MGLGTKTYWLTDRQSLCDFDFDLDLKTSTVTRRVVGGDEKGSLKSESVKYGHEYQGTRTRERLRWRGPSAYIKETRPLVREGASQKQDRNCQTVINTRIWSWAPDGVRHQDLLIDWPSVVMWLWLWLWLWNWLHLSSEVPREQQCGQRRIRRLSVWRYMCYSYSNLESVITNCS
jgi:hypothetical protein